jgi:hypothetical protein
LILVIREPTTADQIREMIESLSLYIKMAVDIRQGILAGGGILHADCEAALLEAGCRQEDIWDADWIPDEREVRCEALINIRPRQKNRSMVIQDPVIRGKVEKIVRDLLEGKMTRLDAVRERYMRDGLDVRLGRLAANLPRIAPFSGRMKERGSVAYLLDESKWFIEWMILDASPELQAELAELQIQLAVWHRAWHQGKMEGDRLNEMISQAQAWSDRQLELSGLLKTDVSSVVSDRFCANLHFS